MNDIDKLESLLTLPSERLLSDLRQIKGDFIILGAGGKMGPSLAVLLKRAMDKIGSSNKIYGVSRFSNQLSKKYLEQHQIKTIAGDLLDPKFLSKLPKVENVLFMAGQKFGTTGNETVTWAMNAYLPGLIANKYADSNIVVFSTGNVYPFMPTESAGATENTAPNPIGEYAQTCLGRERIFSYFAKVHQTPILIYRLNYALDLRYGVLHDLSQKVWNDEVIDLSMGHVNLIWQGDANEYAIRSILLCSSPATILNVTGTEVLKVRELANEIGKHLHKKPVFCNEPGSTALISNASKALNYFGKPRVSVEKMCLWTAQWIKSGRPGLSKPTHYQKRDGNF